MKLLSILSLCLLTLLPLTANADRKDWNRKQNCGNGPRYDNHHDNYRNPNYYRPQNYYNNYPPYRGPSYNNNYWQISRFEQQRREEFLRNPNRYYFLKGPQSYAYRGQGQLNNSWIIYKK